MHVQVISKIHVESIKMNPLGLRQHFSIQVNKIQSAAKSPRKDHWFGSAELYIKIIYNLHLGQTLRTLQNSYQSSGRDELLIFVRTLRALLLSS